MRRMNDLNIEIKLTDEHVSLMNTELKKLQKEFPTIREGDGWRRVYVSERIDELKDLIKHRITYV